MTSNCFSPLLDGARPAEACIQIVLIASKRRDSRFTATHSGSKSDEKLFKTVLVGGSAAQFGRR
jgi:hypothetical protein